ncbi:MAG: hypothetical protein FJX31_11150 [Alphaproteobacteria bacterium]|nr:hypothetical protein [Alphaproteobacteria bacterium]
MFVSLRMLTLPQDRLGTLDTVIVGLRAAVSRLPGVVENLVTHVYPTATINAGHVVWPCSPPRGGARSCHSSRARK